MPGRVLSQLGYQAVDADDPYAALSPNKSPDFLLVLTSIEPR